MQRNAKIFQWKDGNTRNMTVIRGIPMYQSTGMNSKFKNTWLPHLGLDGTRWIRKPHLCLPDDIITHCKKIGLDKKFTLSRFGNTQSICSSASIGTGLWETKEGLSLKQFLLKKHAKYFLSEKEITNIQTAINSGNHTFTKNVNTANHYLKKYGSLLPLNHSVRLPSDQEYSFLRKTKNPKIRSALQMMLVNNQPATHAEYQMIRKLSTQDTIFEYILKTGFLEVENNIQYLTNSVQASKNIILDDLISLNPLHASPLPTEKYPYRKVLRKLPEPHLTEKELYIMKKLDQSNLLDKYAKLMINEKSRLHLIYLDKQNQLNFKTIRKLWKIYENKKLADDIYVREETHHSSKNLSPLAKNSLFNDKSAIKKKKSNKELSTAINNETTLALNRNP